MISAPQIEQIAGRTVLFVMAAKPEYGPALQSRIKPVMTGIGPVEAAIKLTAALTALPKSPDLVVSLGSAGSNRLEHAQVYQATAVAYRDMDASALGFERGCTPLLDLPARVPLPHRIPGIAQATLSTGANIVSGAAYADIAEDMVDMETFSHLRVCQHFGTELIGLRGISDGKTELRGMSDWTEYLHVIDERLAQALDRLNAAMEDGSLPI
ncbi:5'-methylthioadenosine/S-adenosylhomocysteine nucleosidase [Paracoccus seriniphilus]|uniref:Adenosylhomocysteine nucleosidase n=1 Tax=Paracoccus seriniphilus TaxID=184748 RepID=A0A239PMA0_9RHOB|nr:5'-methylthioadenosine/S-adenosylhomocysteine nucleosidase [Paracoccus seriniphilus]WCR13721.1 5'-methylthioadenosine/S-adenosylhomocysteine nucleosidase [Paracoccus seriniphilus]SNT68675.1 adenosylhomocysteine nucleosidase [Paracoccus seriniphilus]